MSKPALCKLVEKATLGRNIMRFGDASNQLFHIRNLGMERPFYNAKDPYIK